MNNNFVYRSSIFKLPEKFLPPTKRRKVQLYKASLLEPLSKNDVAHTKDTSVDTISTQKEQIVAMKPCTDYENTTSPRAPTKSFEVTSQTSVPQSIHASSGQEGSCQDKKTEENSMEKLDINKNREGHSSPFSSAGLEDVSKDKQMESDTSSGEIPSGKLENVDIVSHNLDELKEEVRAQLQGLFRLGVIVPEDFDERAFQFLAWLPPNRAVEALRDLSERNFSNVKKRKAFVMSVLRQHAPSDSQWSSPSKKQETTHETKVPIVVPPSALAHLPPRVADSLQQVFASGVCHPSKFDDRAMEVLVSLDEVDAVQALKEFANVDPSTVRNPSAFWMGIARRYQIRAKKTSSHSSTTAIPSHENLVHSRKMTRTAGMFEWQRAVTEQYSGFSGKSPQSGFSPSYDRWETNRKKPPCEDGRIVTEYIEELTRRNILAPGALDEKVVESLKRIPEDSALTVLREVEHLDQRRIRNISAFVTGLIRKVSTSDNFNQRLKSPTNLVDNLEPRVKQRYLSLFSRGSDTEDKKGGGLDDRALEALSNLRPELSLQVLDELSTFDMEHTRNISMIAMGIMKKVTRRDNQERRNLNMNYR
jgi:hypothetical protein